MTTAGVVTEFTIPTNSSFPWGITVGPDGALWFAELDGAKIGRITTGGGFTEYPIPTSPNGPYGITTGPDGALWFVEGADKVARITTGGAITEFKLPTTINQLRDIATGSDGALWFTESSGNKIGRLTTAGVLKEFTLPTNNSGPWGITAGPDGALWFTEFGINGNRIGRITTAGALTEFAIATNNSGPISITVGPDGALWFAENIGSKIGRLTTTGLLTEFPTPTSSSGPNGITVGPDGALWFTEGNANNIARLSPPANAASLVASVLPSSRSVQVGATATAFATVINAGTSTASSCSLAPVTGVPASFVYQTTNPSTNALSGTANTPVSISGNGGFQTFVIAFTATAPFVPTDVNIGFACGNAAAASSSSGLNTLLLSASTTPVPDVVALGATATNNGILQITGNTGAAAFAVATVNVGATSSITATADTGAATLPLTLSLCQTNPSTGACINPTTPGSSVTATINANTTPTFAIFGTASAAISFAPATSRIFVRFKDSGGVTRGSTSVAVETQ